LTYDVNMDKQYPVLSNGIKRLFKLHEKTYNPGVNYCIYFIIGAKIVVRRYSNAGKLRHQVQ
jgi:hypothetical protein